MMHTYDRAIAHLKEAAAIASNLASMMEARKQAKAILDEMRELSAEPKSADRQRRLKYLHMEYVDLLTEGYTEVQIGFLGGEAYALLGPDRNEGFVCYFKLERRNGESKEHARKRAALKAYDLLLGRLGKTAAELPHRWL